MSTSRRCLRRVDVGGIYSCVVVSHCTNEGMNLVPERITYHSETMRATNVPRRVKCRVQVLVRFLYNLKFIPYGKPLCTSLSEKPYTTSTCFLIRRVCKPQTTKDQTKPGGDGLISINFDQPPLEVFDRSFVLGGTGSTCSNMPRHHQ